MDNGGKPAAAGSAPHRRTLRGTATCAAAVVWLWSLAAPSPAAFIDNIVASVNNEVITESELDHTTALNARLGAPGSDLKKLRAETLSGLITRCLLVQEARRLKFVDVTDQEITAERDALIRRAGSEQAFSALLNDIGLTQSELDRMLSKQAMVGKLVEKKFALFVRVSREEAQQYFDAHRSAFPGKSFSQVQKTIMTRMADERIDEQLDRYIGELRAKADIRMNRDAPP